MSVLIRDSKTGGDLFQMPKGLSENRLNERVSLLKQFDHLKAGLDQDGSMDALNTYQQQAVDLLLGERARRAFDLNRKMRKHETVWQASVVSAGVDCSPTC
jgi:hypothetical protein